MAKTLNVFQESGSPVDSLSKESVDTKTSLLPAFFTLVATDLMSRGRTVAVRAEGCFNLRAARSESTKEFKPAILQASTTHITS
jgi:hypothetical protein